LNQWIFNASPLILLGKINRLDLIPDLNPNFAVPLQVVEEIQSGPQNDPAIRWLKQPDVRCSTFDVRFPSSFFFHPYFNVRCLPAGGVAVGRFDVLILPSSLSLIPYPREAHYPLSSELAREYPISHIRGEAALPPPCPKASVFIRVHPWFNLPLPHSPPLFRAFRAFRGPPSLFQKKMKSSLPFPPISERKPSVHPHISILPSACQLSPGPDRA
jgi:hypothetical protein